MATIRDTPLVALRLEGRALVALDQTLIPWEERELMLTGAAEVADAIRRLAIRGAPLLGVAAGYGVALELQRDPGGLERACTTLRESRPTAVNLAHAVERVRTAALSNQHDPAGAALAEAMAIHREEAAASDALAAYGAEFLAGATRIMTHCNTGALAAPGYGTALAVIAEMARRSELEYVIATETRPLLQGARLTVFELRKLGIPHQLAVDGAAPGLIAAGAVDAVVVGCDRIARNGDVANKVGTYALALAAHRAGIRFVVAGPTSTIDPASDTGEQIIIEERDPREVRSIGDRPLTLPDTVCRNPAFDLTPAELITAIVTERGAAAPAAVMSLLAG